MGLSIWTVGSDKPNDEHAAYARTPKQIGASIEAGIRLRRKNCDKLQADEIDDRWGTSIGIAYRLGSICAGVLGKGVFWVGSIFR